MSRRSCVQFVLACHFISAFAALGMPPFFGLILNRSFHEDTEAFTGIIYVLPTLFAAVAAPLWGLAADRFGKKALLLRAQFGLAISFFAASFAPNVSAFALALVLQGILGGTFAASRAYLGSILSKEDLARSLNWMEASPRLALIVAPILLGIFIESESPLILYRYLSVLPLMAALLAYRLPDVVREPKGDAGEKIARSSGPESGHFKSGKYGSGAVLIPFFQFALGFSSVLVSPYFIGYAHSRYSSLTSSQLGFLFGLPHLLYLVAAPRLMRSKLRSERWIAVTLLILAASQYLQGITTHLSVFIVARVILGLGSAAAVLQLHELIAKNEYAGREGNFFGWLEAISKFSAVLAGLVASLLVSAFGTAALFAASGMVLLAALSVYWVLSGEVYEFRSTG